MERYFNIKIEIGTRSPRMSLNEISKQDYRGWELFPIA
jgi:hypothetical protein